MTPLYYPVMSICHPFARSSLEPLLLYFVSGKRLHFARWNLVFAAISILPDLNFHIAKVPVCKMPPPSLRCSVGKKLFFSAALAQAHSAAFFFARLLSARFPLNRIKFARLPPSCHKDRLKGVYILLRNSQTCHEVAKGGSKLLGVRKEPLFSSCR